MRMVAVLSFESLDFFAHQFVHCFSHIEEFRGILVGEEVLKRSMRVSAAL